MAESRIASVEGFQFSFHREDPERPVRKVMDRWVLQDWVCQVEYKGDWSHFTIHEFNDGVFEPSAVQGVFSDFPGAAAVEVTTRWLQRRIDEAVKQLSAQAYEVALRQIGDSREAMDRSAEFLKIVIPAEHRESRDPGVPPPGPRIKSGVTKYFAGAWRRT